MMTRVAALQTHFGIKSKSFGSFMLALAVRLAVMTPMRLVLMGMVLLCRHVEAEVWNATRTCAIILRGHAFRIGGQGHRVSTLTAETWDRQRSAFLSIQARVIAPAKKKGWSTPVFVDAYTSTSNNFSLKKLASQSLTGADKIYFRVQDAPGPRETQDAGWLRSLAWVNDHRPKSAILLTRLDMFLKVDLRLPSPEVTAKQNLVMVPFAAWDKGGLTPMKNNRVADTMFFIAASRVDSFIEVVNSQKWRAGAHNIQDWWQQRFPQYGPIRYLCPTHHDSDPGKDWNPLYNLTSRREVHSKYNGTERVRLARNCGMP